MSKLICGHHHCSFAECNKCELWKCMQVTRDKFIGEDGKIERGKIGCLECDSPASFVDCAPSKTATADNYWCDIHCPASTKSPLWSRYRMAYILASLSDEKLIWLPYYWVNNELIPWPLPQLKYKWWQFWRK